MKKHITRYNEKAYYQYNEKVHYQYKRLILRQMCKKEYGAPAGIRTRVFGSKGRNDWPDYTTGAFVVSYFPLIEGVLQ
jgi:hypothetical protein